MNYAIGQRWINTSDTELGIGTVLDIDGRLITLNFPVVEEDRTYAANNAPLARLEFRVGDTVQDREGREFIVLDVVEISGIFHYLARDSEGIEQDISETLLDVRVRVQHPEQRLLSAQGDSGNAFAVRLATLQNLNWLRKHPLHGLMGPRVDLIPHQLYIANDVASRAAPRVLLADEVGLGKTIEAGLVIHQQLITGRASRILIIVPEPLLHQWLVEMLRRFNLHFALYDEERYLEYGKEENPFEAEQLVLCGLDWLTTSEDAQQMVLAASWDTLVVDEAHHLHWSSEASSPQYELVKQLSRRSAGLLLLTATPEQVGLAAHFARLHLLDEKRFSDLSSFVEEESQYGELNKLCQALEDSSTGLSTPDLTQLTQHLGLTIQDEIKAAANSAQAIDLLVDRHGTSRVLYRNMRRNMSGFPGRRLHAYPLQCSADYPGEDQRRSAVPEKFFRDSRWLQIDPRVEWLREKLRQLFPAKVLVICAEAETAITLEHYLHLRAGIRCAAFHEQLSIVERDRAAAYFADTDGGAQTLISSEIGSEGRNFQFCQHMVLFDLPTNPDLLEQRIGRLDRIGQTAQIQIHVPYLQATAQEVLYHWYAEGLNAFDQTHSAGDTLLSEFSERLYACMDNPDAACASLIADTKIFSQSLALDLLQGRDRLLERNSCNKEKGNQLCTNVRDVEMSSDLENYMRSVWDIYGVDHEAHSEATIVLKPGAQSQLEDVPGITEDGLTVCFNREIALQREDWQFLSWEHPIVRDSMSLLLSSELGTSNLSLLPLKGVSPGTVLLETVHVMRCPAPAKLQLQRFLGIAPIRTLLDQRGRNLSAAIAHDRLNSLCEPVDRANVQAIIKQLGPTIKGMLPLAQENADSEALPVIDEARRDAERILGAEIARLEYLQRVNPSIRDDEISSLRQQRTSCCDHIANATLELDAVRLIVTR